MNRMHTPMIKGHQAQRGVATLLITLVVLTTITFVLIYSARSVLQESNITANDLRGRQAFEAAEAGQEAAIAYLLRIGGRDKDEDGNVDQVFDTDNDPINDPYAVGDTDTTTLNGGSRVTVRMFANDIETSTYSFTATRIVSTGWSNDGTAQRTITQVYSYLSPLPFVPQNPVLSRGALVVGGAATIFNPEGHSTIWSGERVDLGNNATTSTEIADPSKTSDGSNTSGYPICLGSSEMRPESCVPSVSKVCPCATIESTNRVTVGLDVVERDSSLANLRPDEFFFNFFGTTPENYRDSRVTLDITGVNSEENVPIGANLAVDEVVWVEGDAVWNGITVGCSVDGSSNASGMYCNGDLKPSIVIVNGNLDVKGSITFWGLLYVRGNVSGTGATTVRGAILMEGTSAGMTGDLTVWYNAAVLRSLADNGEIGGGGGSWRDFE